MSSIKEQVLAQQGQYKESDDKVFISFEAVQLQPQR